MVIWQPSRFNIGYGINWEYINMVESNGCVPYIPGSNKDGIRWHQKTGTLGFSQGILDYGREEKKKEVPMLVESGDLLGYHS